MNNQHPTLTASKILQAPLTDGGQTNVFGDRGVAILRIYDAPLYDAPMRFSLPTTLHR